MPYELLHPGRLRLASSFSVDSFIDFDSLKLSHDKSKSRKPLLVPRFHSDLNFVFDSFDDSFGHESRAARFAQRNLASKDVPFYAFLAELSWHDV